MKDYLDLWTEDEKTLWMDTGFTTAIGFITTEDGWGIDKKYLAHKYQWQVIHKLEEEFPRGASKESLMEVASKVERQVLKSFKKSLKGFKLLDQYDNRKEDKLWNELTVDYFKYVLKGELYDMTYRVQSIIDEHYEKLRRRYDTEEWRNSSAKTWDFSMEELISSLASIDRETKDIAYVDLDEEEEEE